jgi:glycosyltransferase involved in cell wall biosynthesis
VFNKPKPKILITVTVAETAWSFLKEQVPFLVEKGYRVEIASGEGSWVKLVDVRNALKVPVHKLPIVRPISVAGDIWTTLHLYMLIRRLRPDILHTSTPKAAFLSLFCGWLARVPLRMYLVRGIPYCNETGLVKKCFVTLFSCACRMAHVVICVSKSNRDFLITNGVCPSDKAIILCNGSSHGVDAAVKFNRKNSDAEAVSRLKRRFGVAEGDIVFGFAGRVVKDKGVEDLVTAWMLFAKNRKNVHLFVVGHRENRDSVSRLFVSKMENEQSIHLVDDVVDPYEYYCIFDVFVFPSHREGFPNAVLEASAMEIPVITTDSLGCVDSVIDGQTGIVVPAKNRDALLDKMQELYNNAELRAKLGKRGREQALKNFDPIPLCLALEGLLSKYCETSRIFLRPRMAIITSVPTTLYHLFSNQVDRIRNEGIDLFFVSSTGDRWITATDVEEKYGIKVHPISFFRTFSIFADIKSFVALFLLFRRLKLDMIYYCTPKASLISSLAAFCAAIPFRIYANFGQVYYKKTGLVATTLQYAERATCALSHKVILMSKSNLEFLLSERLCDSGKMGILGHGTNQGVDAQKRFNPNTFDAAKVDAFKSSLSINKKTKVFGYIGRLVKDKGIIDLIDAWQDVKKEGSCILLLIGPRKEPRDLLPEYIYEKISLDPTIRLIEPVANPEIYYAIMDVFVLPSYREGFPNVVLEAAAMKLPVITTDAIGCVDSVADNETGFIVPVGNVEKMKEKMKQLLFDPELRRKMGDNARERVLRDFDGEAIADDLMFLINNRYFRAKTRTEAVA